MDNRWAEYRRLIISELKRLDEAIHELEEKVSTGQRQIFNRLDDLSNKLARTDEARKYQANRLKEVEKIRDDVIILKTKAAILGALFGLGATILLSLIKNYLGV
ncbi:MAG: hypothetical protein D6732_08255 [Methanobacteriota archaeon]|nr:MAG: hypothetical protein D6732_08255 [Euryarchaeota archaeon]